MNKSIRLLFVFMLISMGIALFWNKIPVVKETVHFAFNPTVGVLLDWNPSVGMVAIVLVISLLLSLIQKYTTDQDTLKRIKKEQKLIQAEMKKYKVGDEKYLELQKKMMEYIPQTFDITLRPLMYTSIPIILFFRWFNDYFIANPVEIFGFFSWFWAYLILSIIFTTIIRKYLDIA